MNLYLCVTTRGRKKFLNSRTAPFEGLTPPRCSYASRRESRHFDGILVGILNFNPFRKPNPDVLAGLLSGCPVPPPRLRSERRIASPCAHGRETSYLVARPFPVRRRSRRSTSFFKTRWALRSSNPNPFINSGLVTDPLPATNCQASASSLFIALRTSKRSS